MRRKDDLLDEGVAAVFGLAGGEAELLGLCFHAEKFTPAEAATWLAGRGFVPLLLVRTSGGIGLVTSTLPRPLRLGGSGRAVDLTCLLTAGRLPGVAPERTALALPSAGRTLRGESQDGPTRAANALSIGGKAHGPHLR